MSLTTDPAAPEQPRYEVPHKYVYLILRRDLPSARQHVVQAAHVAFEAALRMPPGTFDLNDEHWFVVCEVANVEELAKAISYLIEIGVPYCPFFEPDFGTEGEFTSVCTAPREKSERKPLKRFRLWAD